MQFHMLMCWESRKELFLGLFDDVSRLLQATVDPVEPAFLFIVIIQHYYQY